MTDFYFKEQQYVYQVLVLLLTKVQQNIYTNVMLFKKLCKFTYLQQRY